MIQGTDPGKSNRELHLSRYGAEKMARTNVSHKAALHKSIGE